MNKNLQIIGLIILSIVLLCGCTDQTNTNNNSEPQPNNSQLQPSYPHIAGYVANGEELLAVEDAHYDILYSSAIDQETATILKQKNPGMIILYQSPATYMFDSAISVIEAVTNIEITDDFWLKDTTGQRCAYGWTPEMWAINLSNPENIEIMSLFFSKILEIQPQYDGLFFDVMEEQSRCNTMSNSQWAEVTTDFLKSLREKIGDKIIVTNSGYNYNTETPYLQYLNGFALESFLSGAADYDEGLETVTFALQKTREPHYVIYTVYAEHTITQEPLGNETMRLALTLSLLPNNTYLSFDESLDAVGSLLWPQEFSVDLGKPIGPYYEKDNALWRAYENGHVVSSPYSTVSVQFDEEYLDVSTGEISNSFIIQQGDGRIFLLNE